MGRYVVPVLSGYGLGLGDDAKKSAIERAGLQAKVNRGDPGAAAALDAANAVLPAQQAWDALAKSIRDANEPLIKKLPPATQAAARKTLEDQIASPPPTGIGPRPKPKVGANTVAPPPGSDGSGASGPSAPPGQTHLPVIGNVDNSTLAVGAFALVAGIALFVRKQRSGRA